MPKYSDPSGDLSAARLHGIPSPVGLFGFYLSCAPIPGTLSPIPGPKGAIH